VTKGPKNPERSFGLSVGLVLCGIAGLLLWRHRVGRAEVIGGIGALLAGCGLIRPALLRWPSAVWWRFSKALGYVNARVLLTVVFVVLLTPVSIVWRLIGKDPLARKRRPGTGWSPYPERYRDRKHYQRMF
jgi:saxitoxin biosynthesis operon SxtJ-like protein